MEVFAVENGLSVVGRSVPLMDLSSCASWISPLSLSDPAIAAAGRAFPQPTPLSSGWESIENYMGRPSAAMASAAEPASSRVRMAPLAGDPAVTRSTEEFIRRLDGYHYLGTAGASGDENDLELQRALVLSMMPDHIESRGKSEEDGKEP